MSGSNDHRTPIQFLLYLKCLSFYSLAYSLSNGNFLSAVLNSLLNPGTPTNPMKLQNKLGELLDLGHLNEVHEMITACEALPHHAEIVRHRSDSRITYHISGHVARKMLKKTKCDECRRLLLEADDSSLLPAVMPHTVYR